MEKGKLNKVIIKCKISFFLQKVGKVSVCSMFTRKELMCVCVCVITETQTQTEIRYQAV